MKSISRSLATRARPGTPRLPRRVGHRRGLRWLSTFTGPLVLAGLWGLSAWAAPAPSAYWVYFGTYTGGKSEGIYRSRLDLSTGVLAPAELAAKAVNPSFLATHPTRPFLYTVNEIDSFRGKSTGAATAYSIDPATGRLTLLNDESSAGPGPCHAVVDRAGKNLLLANYGGGSVAVLPIQSDGRLGPAAAFVQHSGSSVNPERQKEPHAHAIQVDAGNRFACVPDLGLDKVLVYRFDPAKGSLTANTPPSVSLDPGAGPRHFAFHPDGRHAYVINELLCTVTAFDYAADTGALTPVQTISTLPVPLQRGYSTAEVQVHPSGRFLYGSNRGHHSITVFALDPDKGTLTWVDNVPTQGKTPRNFGIDPTGQFLLAANQDSDTVVVFRIDAATGRLKPTGQILETGMPVCVKFIPVP